MNTNALIIVLSLVTALAAVGTVFWQKSRTRRVEQTHEHTALSECQPELKACPRSTEPEAVPLALWIEEYR